MIGMHQPGPPFSRNRTVVDHRGEPADGSGLRHVGVHDCRTKPAQQLEDFDHRAQIVNRCDAALEVRNLDDRVGGDAMTVEQIAHIAFALCQRAVREQRLAAAVGESRRELDRLNGGPADVQTRDDAQDANGAGRLHGGRVHSSRRPV